MGKKKHDKNKHRTQYQQRYEKGYADGVSKTVAWTFERNRRFAKREGIGEKTLQKLMEEYGVKSFEGGKEYLD